MANQGGWRTVAAAGVRWVRSHTPTWVVALLSIVGSTLVQTPVQKAVDLAFAMFPQALPEGPYFGHNETKRSATKVVGESAFGTFLQKAEDQASGAFPQDQASGPGTSDRSVFKDTFLFSEDPYGGANNMFRSVTRDTCNYIAIGNPGVGKSTFLNSLAAAIGYILGKLLFRSGFSIATGLTYELQVEKVGQQKLMDTPGLSDKKRRQQAAWEIRKALQKSGCYKVFFMFTLQGGRVSTEDITTMQLVLEAAPDIKQYAIIVNKVGEVSMEKFADTYNLRELLDMMYADLSVPRTPHIHFIKDNKWLEDRDNRFVNLTSNTAGFINDVPSVVIEPPNVQIIKIDKYEAMKEEYEQKLAEFKSQLVKQQSRIAELEHEKKRHEEKIEKIEAEIFKHLRESTGPSRDTSQVQELQRLLEQERHRGKQLNLELNLLRLGFSLEDRVKGIGTLPTMFQRIRGEDPEIPTKAVYGSVKAASSKDEVVVEWDEGTLPPDFSRVLDVPPRFLSKDK